MSENDKKKLIQTLKDQGITNQTVLRILASTPREKFIDSGLQAQAYQNHALPISCGQTISQPYIVALMSQSAISNGRCEKVLEIGTGSGYQTAILAQLFKYVYSIERIESLYLLAKQKLANLGYQNIHVKLGDGYDGWPEHGPYDAIVVTASPTQMPFELVKQLNSDHGTLVVPLGDESNQVLKKIIKSNDQYFETIIENVRFVPMLKGIIE